MGILNVTPDSFYDGGKYPDVDSACARAKDMAAAGAGIIDVGGESTRPGASAVSASEEIERVLPVIERIVAALDAPVAVDTQKPDVAHAALSAGACIVNDVTALGAPGMADVLRDFQAGVVLMHMHGEPRTMQDAPLDEETVVDEVARFLKERLSAAIGAGIEKERIVIDPGIGFGKTFKANERLIDSLDVLAALGAPILVGASRKRFIGELTGRAAEDRLAGSLAAHVVAYLRGAKIIRTHDVKETVDALVVAEAIAAQG